MKIIMAYIPVPHSGYRNFFSKHIDARLIILLGDFVYKEFPVLKKNLPALSANEVGLAISAMGWVRPPFTINCWNEPAFESISQPFRIVMPDEDVSHWVAEKYLPSDQVEFDSTWRLRYDKQATLAKKDVIPDALISSDEFVRRMMDLLDAEREKSVDFWRQIAAMITRNGEVVCMARNRHVPTDFHPYVFGDPRFNFSRGVEIELGTADHAESHLIAWCAREGVATKGSDLIVTTFPCPPCAKLVANAGFAHLYFRDGYTMVDSDNVIKARGIEIVQVK